MSSMGRHDLITTSESMLLARIFRVILWTHSDGSRATERFLEFRARDDQRDVNEISPKSIFHVGDQLTVGVITGHVRTNT